MASTTSSGELLRLSFAAGDHIEVELIRADDSGLVALKIDNAYRYDGCLWASKQALDNANALEHSLRLKGWLARTDTQRPLQPPPPPQLGPHQIVDSLIDNEHLVAVHTDEEDRFFVGWLRSHRGEDVLLDEVLADGSRRLGTPVRLTEIQRIEWCTRYLEAIAVIHTTADQASALAPFKNATSRLEIMGLLAEAARCEVLVHIVRTGEPGWYSGLIVGLSSDLVVLRELNEETLELDGYQGFRTNCIASVALDQKTVARKRVLMSRGQLDRPTLMWPNSMLALLTLLTHPDRESAPLVAVCDDDPSASFVGHLIEAKPDGDTTMYYVAPYGVDDGQFSLPTKTIDVVEWGSGYLAAIAGMRRLPG